MSREDIVALALQIDELERSRVARDLHDRLGQSLAAMQLHLRLLLSDDSHRRAAALDALNQITAELGKHTHDRSVQVRPMVIENDDFIGALRGYLENWSAQNEVEVEQRIRCSVTAVSDGLLRSMLYRVTQEALANVAAHASARRVVVELQESTDALALRIVDDGKGFEPARLASRPENLKTGIDNMAARAALIGANLKVESQLGGGTTVTLQVKRKAFSPSAA